MTMTSIMATAGVDFDEGLSGKVTEQQPTNFCGTMCVVLTVRTCLGAPQLVLKIAFF